MLTLAEEDSKVHGQALNQIEAFVKSIKRQVQEDINDVREIREEEEKKLAARKLADQREREALEKMERDAKERRAKEERAKMDLEATEEDKKLEFNTPKNEDSDLDDFIDSDPWATKNKTTESPTTTNKEEGNIGKRDPNPSSSPKKPAEKPDPAPVPAKKIQQTKLKPKKP